MIDLRLENAKLKKQLLDLHIHNYMLTQSVSSASLDARNAINLSREIAEKVTAQITTMSEALSVLSDAVEKSSKLSFETAENVPKLIDEKIATKVDAMNKLINDATQVVNLLGNTTHEYLKDGVKNGQLSS